MTVLWSNRALRSLADIHHPISTDSKEAANRTTLKRGDQLASFPHSGRLVARYNRPGVREPIEAPYRIMYRVRREEVEVLDVFHSAQLPAWER